MDNYYYNEAKQFSEEAKLIMSMISKNELLEIVKSSFLRSSEALLRSKLIAFEQLSSLLSKAGVRIKEIVSSEYVCAKNDLKDYAKRFAPRALSSSLKGIGYSRNYIVTKIKQFNELSFPLKKDLLISGLLWLGVVLLVGGGTDFEGGAPDLDMKIGDIGTHRHVFSHTILLALSIEFLLRFVINLLRRGREYLPHEHSLIWDQVDRLIVNIDKNEDVMVSGVWVGIAIHLYKDANILSDRVKPYVGIPRELSMQAHQNIYATNSFLSFVFGHPTQSRTV